MKGQLVNLVVRMFTYSLKFQSRSTKHLYLVTRRDIYVCNHNSLCIHDSSNVTVDVTLKLIEIAFDPVILNSLKSQHDIKEKKKTRNSI